MCIINLYLLTYLLMLIDFLLVSLFRPSIHRRSWAPLCRWSPNIVTTWYLVSPHESRKRHNVGLNVGKEKTKTSAKTTVGWPPRTTQWGIISGTPVTFCRNSGNYCPNLMILSALWSEIICVQSQTKICHRTLILLLHYVAKTNRECT